MSGNGKAATKAPEKLTDPANAPWEEFSELDLACYSDWCLFVPIYDAPKSGLVIPDTAQEGNEMGRMLAIRVGPGRRTSDGSQVVHNPIQVGDVCYRFAETRPNQHYINGRLYLSLPAVMIAFKSRKNYAPTKEPESSEAVMKGLG